MFGSKNGSDAVVRNHARETVGTQEDGIVGLQLDPVALHIHPHPMAPDNIGDHMAKVMSNCFFRPNVAPGHHLFNEGVVVGQAMQLRSAKKIATAIATWTTNSREPMLWAIVTVVPMPANSECCAASWHTLASACCNAV